VASRHLATFLDTADALFTSRSANAWAIFLHPPTGQSWCQGLAALSLSLADETRPLEMIWSHGALVYHLTGTLPDEPLRRIVVGDLERIVTPAWRRLVDRPFLLNSPRISVPAIEAAIHSPTTGWNKIRAVLQAALPAVSIPSDSLARKAIETMPETQP
jgi:hypothetical protein